MEHVEEAFTKIVSQIFNNWYALRLAVEHSTGGPNSKQTAIECLNYMVQYCLYEPNVDQHMIQEALEDILDEEFETVCEDNSPQEVSSLLFKFLNLLKAGKLTECDEEFNKLPVAPAQWLNQVMQKHRTVENDSSSSDESDIETNASQTTETSCSKLGSDIVDVSMENDGWTEVKSKGARKKK